MMFPDSSLSVIFMMSRIAKETKIFGFTIFFINPETLEISQTPTVLAPPSGKEAINLCEEHMSGLKSDGTEKDELFRPINYNCNTEVKTRTLRVIVCKIV